MRSFANRICIKLTTNPQPETRHAYQSTAIPDWRIETAMPCALLASFAQALLERGHEVCKLAGQFAAEKRNHGTAGCCARAASGHAAPVLFLTLKNRTFVARTLVPFGDRPSASHYHTKIKPRPRPKAIELFPHSSDAAMTVWVAIP
jgi:hypothetical protein